MILDKDIPLGQLKHWGRFRGLVLNMNQPDGQKHLEDLYFQKAKRHLAETNLIYADRPWTIDLELREHFPGMRWHGRTLRNIFNLSKRHFSREDWRGKVIEAVRQLDGNKQYVHLNSIRIRVVKNRPHNSNRLPKEFASLIRDCCNRGVKYGTLIRDPHRRGYYRLALDSPKQTNRSASAGQRVQA
jgi:hypothetical protein